MLAGFSSVFCKELAQVPAPGFDPMMFVQVLFKIHIQVTRVLQTLWYPYISVSFPDDPIPFFIRSVDEGLYIVFVDFQGMIIVVVPDDS